MSPNSVEPVVPQEGWHVLHLFYKIEYAQWELFDTAERTAARTRLSALIQEVRGLAATQLLTFTVVSPQGGFGFHAPDSGSAGGQ